MQALNAIADRRNHAFDLMVFSFGKRQVQQRRFH